MIAVGSAPLPNTYSLIACDHENPQSDGTVTLSNFDSTVRSCNLIGVWETRPAGTAGPWEKGIVSGSIITFHPGNDGKVERVFQFAYAEQVP